MTLDPISKKKLKALRNSGQVVTFAHFWAGMKIEFDFSSATFARARWENLVCKNLRNVSFQDWREFETEFLEAWGNVRDATEEEAYKMLLSKIPHKYRDKVFSQDMKKYGAKPTVFMCNIGEYTPDQATLAIKKFTKGSLTPQYIEKVGPETYHI